MAAETVAAWSQRLEMAATGSTDNCGVNESCDDGMMKLLGKIAALDFDLAVEAAVVATGLLAANQVCVCVYVGVFLPHRFCEDKARNSGLPKVCPTSTAAMYWLYPCTSYEYHFVLLYFVRSKYQKSSS